MEKVVQTKNTLTVGIWGLLGYLCRVENYFDEVFVKGFIDPVKAPSRSDLLRENTDKNRIITLKNG
ncbi:hypothetical protein [Spirulina sp.]|uniref:hypothetical protein n=1 Tax=Spirulina sp. TaxID=1157 RepID=UPI003F6F8667